MASTRDALFVIDPLEQLHPLADSTYVMITEAIRRGHQPWGVTLDGLWLAKNQCWAKARPIAVTETSDGTPGPLRWADDERDRELGEFAAVFMRKDPPFDQDYLTATWCLDRAQGRTLLVNEPAGLRNLNEKLSSLQFHDLIPETRLVRREVDLRRALVDFGGMMIVKPLFGFGGREILQARDGDPNLSTLFEIATDEGRRWTVCQRYVEAAQEGDKRILMVEGEPIGAVLRVPAAGELRNNFHAGGSPEITKLDKRDRQICDQVGPLLREHGQFFAGLDVIGGFLTEINVTSPTGMQEVNRLEGLSGDDTMEAKFWTAVERRLENAQ